MWRTVFRTRPPRWQGWGRGLLALLLAGALSAVVAGVAQAHANLVRSDPAAGAALRATPKQVQLWFSEPIEPSFSKAVVYDVNQHRVDLGNSHVAPNNSESLIVGLKPNLPKGSYAIAWVTQSKIDGHIVRGIVPFGVGVSAAPTTAAIPEGVAVGAVSGSPAEMALRWLVLLSAAALVGSFAFWILQESRSAQPLVGPSGGGVFPIQNVVAVIAWIGFVVSSLVFILDQASIAAGVPVASTLGRPVVETLATQFGRFWILRMAFAGVLGVVLFVRQRFPGRFAPVVTDRAALVFGGALLATFSLTSHSAAVGSLTPLGIANDWLHLAATAIWVGGLLQLAAVVPAMRRDTGGIRSLGTLVERFATVAGLALAVLGLTGLAEWLLHVGTLDRLLGTGYGQALLVKVALIVPLVAVAAINHFLVRPALARGRDAKSSVALAQARDSAALFSWTIRLEALFAILVIGAVGVLTSLSPPRQFSSTAGAGPLTLSVPSGDLVTTFFVSPGRPGPNQIAVDVRNAQGQVPPKIENVFVRFTYLDRDLGTSELVLSPRGAGRFAASSGDLAVTGRWKAEVIVRRAGLDDVWTTYAFAVTPGGARSIQQAGQINLSFVFYLGLLGLLVGCIAVASGAWSRRRSLRRAAALAVCGICLGAGGGYLALHDVQQAQAQAQGELAALLHPATQKSIADGELVYHQHCEICHGVSLQGDGPLAPSLSPAPANLMVHVPLHPDAVLENWIAHGYPGSAMPAFQTKLTEQQRWDVLNYIKSLADGAPPAAATNPPAPVVSTRVATPR